MKLKSNLKDNIDVILRSFHSDFFKVTKETMIWYSLRNLLFDCSENQIELKFQLMCHLFDNDPFNWINND